jgi:hypothetical protein
MKPKPPYPTGACRPNPTHHSWVCRGFFTHGVVRRPKTGLNSGERETPPLLQNRSRFPLDPDPDPAPPWTPRRGQQGPRARPTPLLCRVGSRRHPTSSGRKRNQWIGHGDGVGGGGELHQRGYDGDCGSLLHMRGLDDNTAAPPAPAPWSRSCNTRMPRWTPVSGRGSPTTCSSVTMR